MFVDFFIVKLIIHILMIDFQSLNLSLHKSTSKVAKTNYRRHEKHMLRSYE